jgi:hypothetical protein
MKPRGLGVLLLALTGCSGGGSFPSAPARPGVFQPEPPSPPAEADPVQAAVACGIEFLLASQEGDGKAEWPYEGVYRVGGKIPIGYRVGGTALCASALLRAPGYEQDPARRAAVARAVGFICASADDPLMSPEYDGGYDVRGWGYTYGLALLLELGDRGLTPPELKEAADTTTARFIDAIQRTEIPQVGGWNYARPSGKEKAAPPSPFMTGPTLQALFEASRQGHAVDRAVVERALTYLESARAPGGAVAYSGAANDRSRDGVPGAVGRMLITEVTLYLAGRSNLMNIRGALDAFIVHWEWLDKRRAQPGTHAGPYNIAPYYFYYAHYQAAQAIELLPERERAEYRRRLRGLLFSTRLPDGTWNDRVFPRTANYGTATSVMALLMPGRKPPAGWTAP